MFILFLLGCNEEPTTKTEPEPTPLDVEPCNGRDDDGDGLVDEGNDSDTDGVPDCFDVEECDGVDNDGNGVSDEGFDTDCDGLGDCLDVEECDGLDNDGDSEIDEDFPYGCDPCNGEDDDGDGEIDEDADSDGDGLGDCYDVEECDGLDNDGNGEIDDGIDHDFDGICDAEDVETCDGWDNDGNGVADEGFDADLDGLPDCWIPEVCNGVDDNGDGLIDEGFADDNGDGFPNCRATCDAPTEWTVCVYDDVSEDYLCSYENPITVTSRANGVVVDVNMTGWTTLVLRASVDAWSGFLWHISDSETCNAYGGDAGTTSYDSEAHNDPSGSVLVYDADLAAAALRLSTPVSATGVPSDDVFAQVCQGWFAYRSATFVGPGEAASDTLFQWDGNEVDFERAGGSNDRVLHVGTNRVVGDPLRSGVGLSETVILLGR